MAVKKLVAEVLTAANTMKAMILIILLNTIKKFNSPGKLKNRLHSVTPRLKRIVLYK